LVPYPTPYSITQKITLKQDEKPKEKKIKGSKIKQDEKSKEKNKGSNSKEFILHL
jgi:hypothetical protein